MVPCKSTAKEVLFEWSHNKISLIKTQKLRTTVHYCLYVSIIDSWNKRVKVLVFFLSSGLDEEAHWFVCKSVFKSRCESLMYESHQDLGFVMYNDRDNERGSSVNELWGRNCLQQALVRGTACTNRHL